MNNTNSIGIENMNETDESMPRSNVGSSGGGGAAGRERGSQQQQQHPLLHHQTINQVQYQNQFTSLQKFKTHKKAAESHNQSSSDKISTRKH